MEDYAGCKGKTEIAWLQAANLGVQPKILCHLALRVLKSFDIRTYERTSAYNEYDVSDVPMSSV